MLMVNQLAGFNAGGGSSFALSYLGEAGDGTDLTAYTFASKTLGDAAADRKIIVGVVRDGGSARTVSTLTVGGVSASLLIAQAGGVNTVSAEMWWATVPTGTTGDIVVTFSGGASRCGINWWRLVGAGAAAYDTGSNTTAGATSLADTLNIPAGGGALAISDNKDNATTTWTNLTKRGTDLVIEGTSKMSGADASFAAAQTALAITANYSGSAEATIAMASFGPA